MDVVDDAEGPLDPRIQIELENLNSATDVINKLEIELDAKNVMHIKKFVHEIFELTKKKAPHDADRDIDDTCVNEAHTAFEQLWSESKRRLKDIANKLGASCIDRARCYYQALDIARQAQVQCQYQAQQFQRANEIHKAAKETEALAVARFKSHQHEWNFDQAWQEMLNHATMKVMDAENQKAECAREHHRRATLFQDAESKVQQLQEKYRRSIVKAESYFEIKAQYEQMLATQKERVEYLQKAVKDAKRAYSSSFRALEEISNQIHQQRRDYDMVANGPREPGVGAELISPEDSLDYEADLNKVTISRVDSLASSGEPDTSDRSKDFDDVRDLQQRVDQLGGRSIDGSECFSNQWELELQASMEKLNNLTKKEADWKNAKDEIDSSNDWKDCENNSIHKSHNESDLTNSCQNGLHKSEKTLKNDQNEHKKLPMEFQILKKIPSNTIAAGNSQHCQSLTHSPINSILNRSKIAIRNSISKSLSNSPVNISSFSFGKSSVKNSSIDPARSSQAENFVKTFNDRISNVVTPDKDNGANVRANSENFRVDNSDTSESSSMAFVENRVISRLTDDNNRQATHESIEPSEFNMPKEFKTRETYDSEKNRISNDLTQVQNEPPSGKTEYSSHSVDSTPVRTKTILSRTPDKSLLCSHEDFVETANFKKKSTCKTSSVRELPLLSLFEAKTTATMSKDKSCSMINLAEKRNLKSLLDNSNLGNIHAVSVERLANARNNIMGQHSDTRQSYNKK